MPPSKSLSSAELYTVGWIAALDNELAAAKAALDELHRKPEDFKKHSRDTNNYAWGRIAEHNIVVASLAVGRYGTVSAASTAWAMVSSLPHLRFGLLVGIGSGIPRLERHVDIRLGDIAVSCPTGTSPGVVQYDLGKIHDGGQFERVGSLDSPPEILLKGINALRANYLMEGPRVSDILEDMLRRYPRMKESETSGTPSFAHQGMLNDRLFQSDSVHRSFDTLTTDGGSEDSDQVCAHCDSSLEIRRACRQSEPEVHFGTIASGNAIITSGASRDQVLQALDDQCICFETEAAGLMNTFPCIVIRGICDYADAHQTDRWRNYAAATAAAFTKELLEAIDGEDVERSKTAEYVLEDLRIDLREMRSAIDEIRSSIQDSDRDKQYRDLSEWLSPPDTSESFRQALQKRQAGTGLWFVEGAVFQKWLTQGDECLWVNGFAGCGKSVLCSTAVQNTIAHSQKTPGTGVAYFFFTFSDKSTRNENAMLRSLIMQLAGQLQDGFDMLSRLHQSQKHSPLVTEKLMGFLREMIQKFDRVYVLLDALDEVPRFRDRSHVLNVLSTMRTFVGLRILITSRNEPDIRESLLPIHVRELVMRNDEIDQDIRFFIGDQLKSDRTLAQWHEHHHWIEYELAQRAQGVFRWVECQFESLRHCPRSVWNLEQALNSLPKDLDETYERILCKIEEDGNGQQARRILMLVCFAVRPLTASELIDAIAVDLREPAHFDVRRRLQGEKDILAICPGMIEFRRTECNIRQFLYDTGPRSTLGSRTLRIAHFSVQEYLESERISQQQAKTFALSADLAHTELTRICCVYIFDAVKERSQLEIVELIFPLVSYIASFWYEHYRSSRHWRSQLDILLPTIFTLDSQTFSQLIVKPRKEMTFSYENPIHLDLKSASIHLDLAAGLGLEAVLLQLLSQAENEDLEIGLPKVSNVRTRRLARCLIIAINYGQKLVVQKLLASGVDVNTRGDTLDYPLEAASYARKPSQEMMRILLNAGADINSRGDYSRALQLAAWAGHEDVVRTLLDAGASVNAQGGKYGSALQAASARGHEGVVRILIDAGADVNAQVGPYGNALQAARSHEGVAQILRDVGATRLWWRLPRFKLDRKGI